MRTVLAAADLATPMAVRVAATLRLADRIAAGTDSAAALAAAAGADEAALTRLLRYLVARDIFREPSPGRFALSPAAELLRGDRPERLRDWLDLTGPIGRADLAFGSLLDVVLTGRPGYPMIHGRGFWDDLAGRPELAAAYDALMGGKRDWAATTLAALDWSRSRHVVDVGGGNGTLLSCVLAAHRHLRGTVVDRPSSAEAAGAVLASAGVADRCEFRAGDFFEPLPVKGADTYLLSSIVHDWDDSSAVAILRRCAEAAGPGGRILLCELMAGGGRDQRAVTQMDLCMLVYFGGRERTGDEFAALAERAGLELRTVTPLPPHDWGNSLIECVVTGG
ncbi:methyltransferase [Klebsiella pneumoniae subsp. pneumoniae]|uniref:Methyltransferase n=1 Tax=Planobispora rosea TaxID=35762 RepID=U5Q0I2_PLARO|nr:methyltransferase [Planobispora rosea]AGY49596.1 PbtM4 [Planobispora rosea]MVB68396.1 methyltransferase [Klebsiella pneumoniae subsp. pneumoniae]GGS80335.1 methyltransferase [Planobispora rosea]GIH86021.1 methyltransferase [Planobispora rosea]